MQQLADEQTIAAVDMRLGRMNQPIKETILIHKQEVWQCLRHCGSYRKSTLALCTSRRSYHIKHCFLLLPDHHILRGPSHM